MVTVAALGAFGLLITLFTVMARTRGTKAAAAASPEALLSSGQLKEAASQFEAAASYAARQYGEAHWRVVAASSGRAVALLLLNQVDAAAPLVASARSCLDDYDALPDASLGWAWVAIAMYDAKRGEHHEALHLIERARRSPDVVVLAGADFLVALEARERLALGDAGTALRVLETATDSQEVGWLLHEAAKSIVLGSDDPVMALGALDRLIATTASDGALLRAHARYLRACALHRLGRLREACDEATLAIAELDARDAGAEARALALLLLARVERARGEPEAVSAALARVMAIVQQTRNAHGYRDAAEKWVDTVSADAEAIIAEA
jgi:hypothetical protein